LTNNNKRLIMNKQKRTWHIWIQNSETKETKCKTFEGNDFGYAGRKAFEMSGKMRNITGQIWHIMAVVDVDFSCDHNTPTT